MRSEQSWFPTLAAAILVVSMGVFVGCGGDSTSGSGGASSATTSGSGGGSNAGGGGTGGHTTGSGGSGGGSNGGGGAGTGGSGGAATGGGGTGGGGTGGGASDLCTQTGGTVSMGLCCASAGDFPDSCLIGACSCAPSSSKMVKTCECPDQQCYDAQLGCKNHN